ncbi:MAG: energy transducer TonB [Rhodocyclaceae bacterium]|nr:energy transducer TonB [Rhodocyclaceae bacterium]
MLSATTDLPANWPARALWALFALAAHGVLVAVIARLPANVPAPLEVPISIQLLAAEAAPVAQPAPLPAPREPLPAPAKPQARPARAATPAARPAAAPQAVAESAAMADQRVAAAPLAAPAAAAASAAVPAEAAPPALIPASFDAAYLDNPKPAYPALSRRMREQGKVLLRAWVTALGSAEKLEIKQSSNFERLDDAALAAVARWRFVPAQRGGVAVATWVLIPISFSLEN